MLKREMQDEHIRISASLAWWAFAACGEWPAGGTAAGAQSSVICRFRDTSWLP